MLNKIRNNFLAGIAILLPAVLTVLIFRYLILMIDNIILDPVVEIFKPYTGGIPVVYLSKGIAFLIVVLFISFIGFAARIIVLKRVFSFGERIVERVPMVSKIYFAIKELASAFFGRKIASFNKVALIEYPRKGVYSICFVTSEVKGEIARQTGGEKVSVFVPTTPNPTSGFLLVADKEELKMLDISVEEGMKFVISAGVVGTDTRRL